MPYLSQVRQKFVLYNLKEIANFGSLYTTRLYELIQEFKETGYMIKSVQQLRESFAVGEKFKAYKDNIDINVKENKMTVKGEIESDNEEYLYKGISTKKFFKTFSLAEYTEPTEATMENGVLKIKLKQELPEEKKPKTIKIK